MSLLVALDLASRWCLVVGDGAEALLRVRQFKAQGAQVRWVHEGEQQPNEADEEHQGDFGPEHLDQVWVAVLADRNDVVAARMQTLCDARRIWFCAVDQPAFNNFSHVARLDVGPLAVGISSDGRAPLLSRRVREGLQQLLDTAELRAFFRSIAELREQTPPAERRAALTRALDGFQIEGRVLLPNSAAPAEVAPEPPSDK
jgi:siroheme synthase-like protein